MDVFFNGGLAPFAGRPPPPSDILAARNAALLFVLGMIVGGAPTLSRAFGLAGVASVEVPPSMWPLALLIPADTLRGFELMPPEVLGLEEERESGGRVEPLA